MPTKKIGARVKVRGKEGIITGFEGPKAGETKKVPIKWKVKIGKAEGKWYDDSQVTAID